jgi:hypothetical protein
VRANRPFASAPPPAFMANMPIADEAPASLQFDRRPSYI